MKVTANINKMDFIRFNLAIFPQLKSTYITVLAIGCLVFALICWNNGFPHTAKDLAITLVASFIGGVSGTLFGALFSMICILFMSSSNNGILGEHEYAITPEGLRERTSANEGLSKWEGISKVKVVGSYLLFQISGYLFHIVPARSFESAKEFENYASISTEHWQSAHNKRLN